MGAGARAHSPPRRWTHAGWGHSATCLGSLLLLGQLPWSGSCHGSSHKGRDRAGREQMKAQGRQLTCLGPVAGEPTSLEPKAKVLPHSVGTGSEWRWLRQVTGSHLSVQVWWQLSRSPRHTPCMCVLRGRTLPSPAESWALWLKGTT